MNAPQRAPTDAFNVDHVRCHWPKLREIPDVPDDDNPGQTKKGKPNAQLILDKVEDKELIDKLFARSRAVCRAKNPDKEKDGKFEGQGRLVDPSLLGLIDGDYVKGDEWRGKYRITASVAQASGEPPRFARVVSPFDGSKEIPFEEPTMIYAGCYCNWRLKAWFSKKGSRVAFELVAIQFQSDAERLIGGFVDEDTEDMGFGATREPKLADDNDWGATEPGSSPTPTPANTSDDDEGVSW